MNSIVAAWRVSWWRRRVLPDADVWERRCAELDDANLTKAARAWSFRLKCGEPLAKLLPEALGLVREAARRTLGLHPYEVQLLGGMALLERAIVEMQTGEGKTLTALLPAFVRAAAGKGMHVATANDYLAARDAQTLAPVYAALGLTVGVVTAESSPAERRLAYQADVTYGTAKEFGFDFLRDRLAARRRSQTTAEDIAAADRRAAWKKSGGDDGDRPLQRPPYAVLIDEADSILLDEASTPLVIGAPLQVNDQGQRLEVVCYRWAATAIAELREGVDYFVSERPRIWQLTADGRRHAREMQKPREVAGLALSQLYEYLERALRVERDYLREREYVVRNGAQSGKPEILIIDEFTGRPGEGRRWQDGIHEAIEAKEGLAVQVHEGHVARVTVQAFFRRYAILSGMTGTASAARREFRKMYLAGVVTIPTHRPSRRELLPTRVFGTAATKLQAVVEEVCAMQNAGRPVLIGTRSIDKSEQLSRLLAAAGVAHHVLNAHRLREEAEIVAHAGEARRVTVATNMAGRGTDIALDDAARAAGGLHVIGTELHESQRIDRQLIGRCARQGDPGTFRQFVSLDDDILEAGLGLGPAEALAKRGQTSAEPLESLWPLFRRAQQRLEGRQFTNRRQLMFFEQQREKSYREMGLDYYLDSPG